MAESRRGGLKPALMDFVRGGVWADSNWHGECGRYRDVTASCVHIDDPVGWAKSPAVTSDVSRGGCAILPTRQSRQLRTRPPSTLMVWPVMKAASSLVRNDSAPTRSAGVSGRLIACIEAAMAN